jgi:hypothetical protein
MRPLITGALLSNAPIRITKYGFGWNHGCSLSTKEPGKNRTFTNADHAKARTPLQKGIFSKPTTTILYRFSARKTDAFFDALPI